MLHHLSLPVSDMHKSRALYVAALGALGYRQVCEAADFAGFGLNIGEDMFALKLEANTIAASAGFHVAFAADSHDAVDAFYAAALEHGATDNGAPGLRPHYAANYYAAFVIDLDGHRLEVVHF
ncbi:VOC family protein [Litoreibacter sp.]|nr:VOC family protein [Litoreibacter sp.]